MEGTTASTSVNRVGGSRTLTLTTSGPSMSPATRSSSESETGYRHPTPDSPTPGFNGLSRISRNMVRKAPGFVPRDPWEPLPTVMMMGRPRKSRFQSMRGRFLRGLPRPARTLLAMRRRSYDPLSAISEPMHPVHLVGRGGVKLSRSPLLVEDPRPLAPPLSQNPIDVPATREMTEPMPRVETPPIPEPRPARNRIIPQGHPLILVPGVIPPPYITLTQPNGAVGIPNYSEPSPIRVHSPSACDFLSIATGTAKLQRKVESQADLIRSLENELQEHRATASRDRAMAAHWKMLFQKQMAMTTIMGSRVDIPNYLIEPDSDSDEEEIDEFADYSPVELERLRRSFSDPMMGEERRVSEVPDDHDEIIILRSENDDDSDLDVIDYSDDDSDSDAVDSDDDTIPPVPDPPVRADKLRFNPSRVAVRPAVFRLPISSDVECEMIFSSYLPSLDSWEWCSVPDLRLTDPRWADEGVGGFFFFG